jgi:hypothetical protein
MDRTDNSEDAETADEAARRAAILDYPDDPPDDSPELSAGSLSGSGVVIHETNAPDSWVSAENPVEAPDYDAESDG